MFRPVPMKRLSAVVLERDERAVLRVLGRWGVMQLTRTAAGPDTAPLPPRDRSHELARCDRLLARVEDLRRSLAIQTPAEASAEPLQTSLDQAEEDLRVIGERADDLLSRRQRLAQRLGELTTVCDQVSRYRGLEIPLDQPDRFSFLHFVTGTLPAENFDKLQNAVGDPVAWLPLPAQEGRQPLIAMTTREGWPALETALQQAGFQREPLPVVEGATTDTLAEKGRREQEQVAAELAQSECGTAGAGPRSFTPFGPRRTTGRNRTTPL